MTLIQTTNTDFTLAFLEEAEQRLRAGLAERRAGMRGAREAFSQSEIFGKIRSILTESAEPLSLDSVAADIYPESVVSQPIWSFMSFDDLTSFVDVFNDASLPGANASKMESEELKGIEYVSYQSFGLYVTVMLGARGCAATYVRNQAAQALWEVELARIRHSA